MFGKIDKKIFGMISSIFTLVVALVLSVISLTISWFAMNDNVGANNMQINIESPDSTTVFGKRYIAVLTSGDSQYTKGDEIDLDNKPSGYNMLGAYDKVIYEFEVEGQASLENLSLSINATRDDVDDSFFDVDGDLENKYNYLSNVASFVVLEKENNVYTEVGETYQFGYFSSVSRVNSLNLGQIARGQTISILFNYIEENINALFNANVGYLGDLYFVEDIMFVFS